MDSLRGFAAIGVALFYHYQHYIGINTYSGDYPFSSFGFWFFKYGWSLVDFFFVLSGFVFSYVYKEKIAQNKIGFKEYCFLRFSRLFPLHFVTLVLVAIFQWLRINTHLGYYIYSFNDTYHFVLNLFLVQSFGMDRGWSFNGPSWSISCEIVAYLIFFGVTLKYRHHIWFYLIFILSGIFIANNNYHFFIINSQVARVLMGFFAGCFFYELNFFIYKNHSRSPLGKMFKENHRPFLYNGLVFLLVITILLKAKFYGQDSLGNWSRIYTLIVYPGIIILAINNPFLRALLSLKIFSLLGDISYSIYLLHFPIHLIIFLANKIFNLHFDYYSKIFFLFNFTVIILISYLSYTYFEKPVLLYSRTWFKKRKTGPGEGLLNTG